MEIRLNTITNRKLFLLTCCLIACFSCTDDNWELDQQSRQTKIELSASYPLTSRASELGFADGDHMGIYVADCNKEGVGILQSSGNHADNIRFTFDEQENRWNGDLDLFWKDKHTPIDVYGYYPFRHEVADVNQLPVEVAEKQQLLGDGLQMGGYEASDFLWAKAQGVSYTANQIPLTYRHLMACVNVTLKMGDGFTADEWNDLSKQVLVKHVVLNAMVDLEKGKVSSVGDQKATITPYATGTNFRAVVVPQTISGGTELLSLTVDGHAYQWANSETLDLQSGMMHQFTIEVTRKAEVGDYSFKLLNQTIKAWIDDPDFHDGILREYLVVDVPEGGMLAKVLQETGRDIYQIKGLKLTGKLSPADIAYLGKEAIHLENLNLKDIVLVDNQGTPTYVLDEMSDCKELKHIVLPQKLKVIDNSCFYGSTLIGALILPEGLERIGSFAFAYCSSLRGDLIIPQSVTKIGDSAFQKCGFNGTLSLPAGITEIEDNTFELVHFRGRINLPEGLKRIGKNAFRENRFSGDLIFPQSLVSIGEECFRSKNCYSDETVIGFGSNLELNEGLISIGSGAFHECHFKGELKLPSTLRFLGAFAFYMNDISRIIFPDELDVIEESCFQGCRYLRYPVCLPKKLKHVQSNLFADCELLPEVELHEDIFMLGENVFLGCLNLSTIVCHAVTPPTAVPLSFNPDVHATRLQVPSQSVTAYRNSRGWGIFHHISANRHFVCHPYEVGALNNKHVHHLTLNSPGAWKVDHLPAWCTMSPMSGNLKTDVTLTIKDMPQGSENRCDSVVFKLMETGDLTYCKINQYDYEYPEDGCVQLHKATKGNGVNVVFLAEGFDAKSIADDTYLSRAKRYSEYLLETEPYKTYQDYLNINVYFSISQETGVNTIYSYRDIKFGTRFGGCKQKIQLIKELVTDYVRDYVGIPEDKQDDTFVAVLVNSSEYSGNTIESEKGDWIGMCTHHTDSVIDKINFLRYAAGGAFGRLADESHDIGLFPPEEVKKRVASNQISGFYQNISLNGSVEAVPWKDFIYDPRYSDFVDIYEGSCSYARGLYRCEMVSCMTGIGSGFNLMSRMEIVRRILDISGEGFTMDKFLKNDCIM